MVKLAYESLDYIAHDAMIWRPLRTLVVIESHWPARRHARSNILDSRARHA